MKQITFILVFLFSNPDYCQTTFVVDNFSKAYFGELYIADTTDVFSKGWVAIFDKKSKKQLIKINSDELTFELHKGEILANIKELPYGEQSQILYEDYNFDGIKDFAIMDGQNSCYHGPSYQIFLATDNEFKHSPEFTELAQMYCGMFDIDHKTQTIRTMTKSGCCWHQYSEFKVRHNKPYPTYIIEERWSASGIYIEYLEQILVNGKMVTTGYDVLHIDEVIKENMVLSFGFENKKKLRIFVQDNTLYYSFTDADEKIELLYYDAFQYSIPENTLSFTNGKTEYIIYDDKIIAKTPKKIFVMKAVTKTIFGTLTKLNNLKIENVIN